MQTLGFPAHLTDVLQVFDVVPLRAHDLIDHIGSHLVPVLQRPAKAQAVVAGVQVAILDLAGPLYSIHTIFLVYP